MRCSGENGAGKSTLMRVLGGEMHPSERRGRHRRAACRLPRSARPRAPSASPSSIRSWRSRRIFRWPRTSSSASCPASSPGRRSSARATELIERLGFDIDPAATRRQPRGRPPAGGRDRQGAVAGRQDHRLRRADRRALDAGTPSGCTRSSRTFALARRRHRLHLPSPRRGAAHLRPHDGHEGRPGRRHRRGGRRQDRRHHPHDGRPAARGAVPGAAASA